MAIQKGNFYNTLISIRQDGDDFKRCIEETVEKLKSSETSVSKPGILLGKIQSGKTRAFIGVIALAFDNGYDAVIVLTKGTKALAEQTYQRIVNDFQKFIDEDEVQIFDILNLPSNLTPWELKQKLIIVAKKEINNLQRIIKAVDETYPDLKSRKLLIIDDEADFASISFRKDRDSGEIELGRIARTIDGLREKAAVSDFLQVTATPYSLYLQPENEKDGTTMIFKPKRPCFTVLLPIHESYVGGDFYFVDSQNDTSPAYFIFEEVPIEERDILKKEDKRRFRIEDVLTAKSISVLRRAVINFIVGGAIRQLQQKSKGIREEKYSFIVHTEQSRASHDWQESIATRLIEELKNEANKNESSLLEELIRISYEDLKKSVIASGSEMPNFEAIKDFVKNSLREGFVVVTRVNSDNDVKQLLDNKGQLKLRTPLNIFIGGQILDRGLTIKNLIGFYYGRNPQRFQQDTVLQHSRMYGSRFKEDLSVTRFYTTLRIYEMMRKINEFDEALRDAFLKGAHDNGVYFIRKDALNRLIPCSPNKVLLSNITTLRPYKRILPIGFQTGYKSYIKKVSEEIDSLISKVEKTIPEENGGHLIDIGLTIQLLKTSTEIMEFDEQIEWDLKGAIAAIEHISKITDPLKEKAWLVIRKGNNMSRTKEDGRFSDDPDGGSAPGAARTIARKLAENIPALIMTGQNGLEEKGWRDAPFWWPVVIMPKSTPVSIFASETIDKE